MWRQHAKELNHIVLPGEAHVDHVYMRPPRFIDLMDQSKVAILHTTHVTQDPLKTTKETFLTLVGKYFLGKVFRKWQ
jgi:hypothetical protein